MKSTRSSDMAVSFLGCQELGQAAGHELIGSVRLFPMSSRFWTMHQFTAAFRGSPLRRTRTRITAGTVSRKQRLVHSVRRRAQLSEERSYLEPLLDRLPTRAPEPRRASPASS